MSGSKAILVLGGGVGGLVTAVTLRRKLPVTHRIFLVDRERDHLFQPSLLWIMTGARRSEQIVRSLDRLTKKSIEVIRQAAAQGGRLRARPSGSGREQPCLYHHGKRPPHRIHWTRRLLR